MAKRRKGPPTPKSKASKLREGFGLTQEDFAHMLHVSFTTVNRWENGHAEPTGLGGTLLELLSRAQDHAPSEKIADELHGAKTREDVIERLALLSQQVTRRARQPA